MTTPMQRGDLVLCRHLDVVGLPVAIAARGPVPVWMTGLPRLCAVIDPMDLAAVARAAEGVVVCLDEPESMPGFLAVLQDAGTQIVHRHGAGWRIHQRLSRSRPRWRDLLVRKLPMVGGWLGLLPLRRPFRHDGGQCWWTSLRGLRRPPPGSARRPVLFENDRPMPFPDSVHEDIRRLGRGRYSVWEGGIYLSSSDGSDPTTNGRRYEVRLQDPGEDGELTVAVTDEESFARRFAQVAAMRSAAAPAGRRVLILTSSLSPGGAERQFAYLAKGLAQTGFEVAMLSLDGFVGTAGHYLPMVAGSGVTLLDGSHAHPDFSPHLLGGRPAAGTDLLCDMPELFAAEVWRIASHVAVFAPDVLHCALDKPNLLGAVAGTCLGVPRIVLSMRNVNPTHMPYLDTPWYRRWYALAAEVPGLVLSANSHAGAKDYAQWIGLPPERIRVVHNGLDTDAIREPAAAAVDALRRELAIPQGAPVIAGVFRLSAEKRPFLWLDVVTALRRQYPTLVALHVGLGALTEAVAARVEERGLGACIRLLGRRQDIEVVLHAADVLLLVSEFEGFPNVVLEAQWLERPVVCTAAGGTAEAVLDGTTALVARAEVGPLAEACARLLEDPGLRKRMGQTGRRHVATQFSATRMVEGSIALYGA